MEKRTLIAFSLSLLIIMCYPYFLKKISPAPKAPETSSLSAPREESGATLPKSLPAQSVPEPAGELRKTAEAGAEREIFSYKDDVYAALFTNVGGALSSLRLRDYDDGKTDGNLLIKAEGAYSSGFAVRVMENNVWDEGLYVLDKKDQNQVTLSWEKPGAFRIRKAFSFFPEKYALMLEVTIENLSGERTDLEYEITAPLFIGDVKPKDRPSLEADYFHGDQREIKGEDKLRKDGFLKEGPVDWVALKKKYFALIVRPETPLEHVRSLSKEESLTDFLKPATVRLEPQGKETQRYFIYAGPKSYDALKSYGEGYEKILNTKFLGGLWLYFLILLKLLYKVFHNYGVAIIVLSSLIKLVFTPLTHMSFESMRKMQALQPKIKALQEQLKNDPQKLNREIMQLYKKNKVNPFGGCLPMLLQMPIFIALYTTFSQAIELRGAPFAGWIKDLSEPDQFFLLPYSFPVIGNQVNILPLIMIGTMLWQQKLTPQTAATKDQEKIMLFMPLIFGFVFYGLPSGLVIYWIVNNLLTIFHQLFIKKIQAAPAHE